MSDRRRGDELRLGSHRALNPPFRAFTTVDAAGARARAREVDAAESGRPLARPAPWHDRRRQGQHRYRRHPHGLRLAAFRRPRFPTPTPRSSSASAEPAPSSSAKTAMMELAFGVRSLDADRRPVPQSVEPRPRARRIERRVGRGCGARSLRRRARHRYGRLGPHARGVLRRHRPASHPWPRFESRRSARSASRSIPSGPMARRVEDVARLLCGDRRLRSRRIPNSVDRPLDALRSSTSTATSPDFASRLPRNFYFDDVDPEVEAAVRDFAECAGRRRRRRSSRSTVDGAEEAHRHATTIILCRRLRPPCRRARRRARPHLAAGSRAHDQGSRAHRGRLRPRRSASARPGGRRCAISSQTSTSCSCPRRPIRRR